MIGFQVADFPAGMINTPIDLDTTYRNTGWLGQEFFITSDSGYRRRVRVMKNDTGTTLYPKELVEFEVTAGEMGTHIRRLCNADGSFSRPIHDGYPSTGIPNGDACLVVMEGPCLVMTPASGVARGAWSVDDRVIGTASGRAVAVDTSLATTPMFNQLANNIGKAMSAVTSGNTSADRLVWIGHP